MAGRAPRIKTPAGDVVLDPSPKVALVVARFNLSVTQKLKMSAVKTLKAAGLRPRDIGTFWVPGALEVPQMLARLARGCPSRREIDPSRWWDAAIGLGCVIKGGTDHHLHVGRVALDGLGRLALEAPFPVLSGILTVDRLEDAMDRAGGKEADRGEEVASACLEMIAQARSLDQD